MKTLTLFLFISALLFAGCKKTSVSPGSSPTNTSDYQVTVKVHDDAEAGQGVYYRVAFDDMDNNTPSIYYPSKTTTATIAKGSDDGTFSINLPKSQGNEWTYSVWYARDNNLPAPSNNQIQSGINADQTSTFTIHVFH